jgi:oxygen-independent coproporphyrinogen-3 oxidase
VIVSRNPAIVERYMEGLAREISIASQALAAGNRRVAQFHLGGGTPTYFPPEALERLHGMVAARFEILPDAELAIEVDPRVTTPEHVRALAGLGWRRVSMGVQDFDPLVQAEVSRIQPPEPTAALVDLCRAEGFASVNIDLIYGLPFQTPERFAWTLEFCIGRLKPDRVSLFGYAHVPWLKAHQKRIDEAALPGPGERLALFHLGVSRFVEAGYEYIGLDHFARPEDDLARARREGTLRRNFMGFHTHAGTDMVAFGITGIGDCGGTYLQNAHRLTEWERDLAAGRLPVRRGYRRTEDDRLRGAVISSLMCLGRVGREVLTPGEPDWRPRWEREARALEPMEADGLLVMDAEGIRLTPVGRLFVRNAAMAFDAHLARERASGAGSGRPRYSRTV